MSEAIEDGDRVPDGVFVGLSTLDVVHLLTDASVADVVGVFRH